MEYLLWHDLGPQIGLTQNLLNLLVNDAAHINQVFRLDSHRAVRDFFISYFVTVAHPIRVNQSSVIGYHRLSDDKRLLAYFVCSERRPRICIDILHHARARKFCCFSLILVSAPNGSVVTAVQLNILLIWRTQ